MKFVIATDHRGVEYKKDLCELLKDEFEIIDASPINDPKDDYPDFAFKVGAIINKKEADFGVLICGTGIGMSIAANKVRGIRCALITNANAAKYAKNHNDANVLAFGSNMEPKFTAECIKIYASTFFDREDEKHARRVKKVMDYENGEYNEL